MKSPEIERLYFTHKDHLYNYIYQLCQDHQVTQDVVQQTFLKLMERGEYHDIENIKSYLFTMGRNFLFDVWKKKKEVLVESSEEMEEGPWDLTDSLLQEVDDSQMRTAIENSMQRLRQDHRELLILRYMEGMSVREIAAITQKGESHVKVGLFRARKKFDLGLTKHLYLRVAKSRRQCQEIEALLRPYEERDIPDDDVPLLEKHLDKCPVCSEDVEELRRRRKLFALIPLIGVPALFDGSMNQAMAAESGKGGIVAGSMGMKVIIVTLIIAGISLGTVWTLMDVPDTERQEKIPDIEQAKKGSSTKAKPKSYSGGTIPLQAELRITRGGIPVDADWYLFEQIQGKKGSIIHSAARQRKYQVKVKRGDFLLRAQLGETQIDKEISVTENKPISISLLAEAGRGLISTPFPQDITLYASQLRYEIYRSKEDLLQGKLFKIKTYHPPASEFTLPAGNYRVRARYYGFGKIEQEAELNIRPGEDTPLTIPLSIGLLQPRVLLSQQDIKHINNIEWSIVQRNGKPVNSTIRVVNNDQPLPMEKGEYEVSIRLGEIRQASRFTIAAGKLTRHKLILQGGLVRANAWQTAAKKQHQFDVNFRFYHAETPDKTIHGISEKRAALPPGRYGLEVSRRRQGKNILIDDKKFELKDGETKLFDFIAP